MKVTHKCGTEMIINDQDFDPKLHKEGWKSEQKGAKEGEGDEKKKEGEGDEKKKEGEGGGRAKLD